MKTYNLLRWLAIDACLVIGGGQIVGHTLQLIIWSQA